MFKIYDNVKKKVYSLTRNVVIRCLVRIENDTDNRRQCKTVVQKGKSKQFCLNIMERERFAVSEE